jgi:hypothetical protein
MKNYYLNNLKYIKDNQKALIKDAELCNDRFKFNFKDQISTTWYYRYYNFASLSVGTNYYYVFKQLQKIIRKFVKHNKPLWYQCWLNFDYQDKVLNWHNHIECDYHGYISIRPHNTETQFENYTIKNKVGNIYIGDPYLKHRVNVIKPFNTPRITLGFDIVSEKSIKYLYKKYGKIDINTAYIPIYETN